MIVDHNTEIALKDLACSLWATPGVINVTMETPYPYFVHVLVSARGLTDAHRRNVMDAISDFHHEFARVVSIDVDIQDENTLALA